MNNKRTEWNDPEFIEAIRLANKFFPESRGYIHEDQGISIYKMIESMQIADFKSDYSCEHFVIPEGPDLGLNKIGGFEGENDEIYARLISHVGISPTGRVVVIPDALGKGWSLEHLKPFVCDIKTLPVRLSEIDCFFDESHDRILVFESGEVICIDHDLRVFWACSRIRKSKQFTTKPKTS